MTATLLSTFHRRAEQHGDRVALRDLKAGGAPADVDVTWSQWHSHARSFARSLRAHGCRTGDMVAVLAGNSPAWPIAELGAQMAGAVTVGIYPTSAPVQVHAILNDCAARFVVVDTIPQLEKVYAVRSAVPSLECVVCVAPTEGAHHFEEWISGPALADVHEPRPDDVALLIYTSGSTGEPKGARISHRYLMASACSIADTLELTEADSSLSFLPFCHAAERIFGMWTRVHTGMTAGLVRDHTRIWDAARAFEPTLFGGLPRFYEKLYEVLTAAEPEAVARRLAEHVGGRVRIASSGGATLPDEITAFLTTCGLNLVGAYGLTEHLCLAMQRPGDHHDFKSVGRAMPGSEVRISESGEILVRVSDLTFSGYHNRPAETREAFTPDGEWLRTGDLGSIDDDGYIYVHGREKELIALSTGKKVAPLPIEARLINHPMISQAVVVGENRKFVSALIALRPVVVQNWATQQGISAQYSDLLQRPELRALVQQEIDRVNADLSRPEQIRQFVVLPGELSIERDELTPTLKIRRDVVTENYRKELEALYQVSA